MSATVDIRQFADACIHQAGGVAEADGNALEALLPDRLAGLFGGRDAVRIGFAPGEAPPELLMLPGSALMDGLLDYAGMQGPCTHAWPRVGTVAPRSIAGEIERNITFTARRVQLPWDDALVSAATVAQFDFVVSLVSDDREDGIQAVAVDCWFGCALEQHSAVCRRLGVDATEPSPAAARLRVGLDAAFQVAVRTLRNRQDARLRRRQAAIARRLGDERFRLNRYYDGIAEDLDARLRRSAPDRAADLCPKREAVEREREVKLAEMAGK
jgi:hypothetical protein